jgi:hypothetical protein
MYIEFIENTLKHTMKVVALSDIIQARHRPFQAYRTIFPFDKTVFSHLENTKSEKDPEGNVKGFAGKVFCDTVFFDIDGGDSIEDIEVARQETRKLANFLAVQCNVQPEHIEIYFSGGKGFHLALRAEHFGGFPASAGLPSQVRAMQKELKQKLGLNHLDTAIQAPVKFIRLPNSRHQKTGLYKIRLKPHELSLEVEEIMEIAQGPVDYLETGGSIILPSEELVALKERALTKPENKNIIEGEDVPKGDSARFDMAVRLTLRKYSHDDYFQNNRNNFMHQLAAWCNDLGVGEKGNGEVAFDKITDYCVNVIGDDPDTWDVANVQGTILGLYERDAEKWAEKKAFVAFQNSHMGRSFKNEIELIETCKEFARNSSFSLRRILFFLRQVNNNFDLSLPEAKLEEIVANYSERTFERDENNLGFTAAELVPEIAENVSAAIMGKAQSCGIALVDKLEGYNFRGKYCQILGKQGVGKSALLLQVARSMCEAGHRAVISTMEDSRVGFGKRILKGSFQAEPILDDNDIVIGYEDTVQRLSKYFADPEKRHRAIEMVQEELNGLYGDRMIIDDETSMGADQYRVFIEALIKKYGHVEALGVDGHSMMADHGLGEVHNDIRNAAGLKKLANEYKIGVFDLVHVPTPISSIRRALHDVPRSGSKVAEPADLFFSLSRFEAEDSLPDDPKYIPNYIHFQYYGKRTTGKTKNLVLEVDFNTMHVQVSDIPVEEFTNPF